MVVKVASITFEDGDQAIVEGQAGPVVDLVWDAHVLHREEVVWEVMECVMVLSRANPMKEALGVKGAFEWVVEELARAPLHYKPACLLAVTLLATGHEVNQRRLREAGVVELLLSQVSVTGRAVCQWYAFHQASAFSLVTHLFGLACEDLSYAPHTQLEQDINLSHDMVQNTLLALERLLCGGHTTSRLEVARAYTILETVMGRRPGVYGVQVGVYVDVQLCVGVHHRVIASCWHSSCMPHGAVVGNMPTDVWTHSCRMLRLDFVFLGVYA